MNVRRCPFFLFEQHTAASLNAVVLRVSKFFWLRFKNKVVSKSGCLKKSPNNFPGIISRAQQQVLSKLFGTFLGLPWRTDVSGKFAHNLFVYVVHTGSSKYRCKQWCSVDSDAAMSRSSLHEMEKNDGAWQLVAKKSHRPHPKLKNLKLTTRFRIFEGFSEGFVIYFPAWNNFVIDEISNEPRRQR